MEVREKELSEHVGWSLGMSLMLASALSHSTNKG